MIRALVSSASVALFVVCIAAGYAGAQSLPNGKGTSDGQWVSHQMNQPLPDKPARYKMSQARVDDIRHLYELAKKEIASKQSDAR